MIHSARTRCQRHRTVYVRVNSHTIAEGRKCDQAYSFVIRHPVTMVSSAMRKQQQLRFCAITIGSACSETAAVSGPPQRLCRMHKAAVTPAVRIYGRCDWVALATLRPAPLPQCQRDAAQDLPPCMTNWTRSETTRLAACAPTAEHVQICRLPTRLFRGPSAHLCN
jgi:hypothetical protein